MVPLPVQPTGAQIAKCRAEHPGHDTAAAEGRCPDCGAYSATTWALGETP